MGGWSSAAADVTNAEVQDRIADTLLSDESRNLGSVSELYARTEATTTQDENGLYPDDYPPGAETQELEAEQEQLEEGWSPDPTAEEELQELQYELRDEMALELAEQQAQQAQQVPEPSVAESMQFMNAAIDHLQLPDSAAATELASAISFGEDPAQLGWNVESLDRLGSMTALSAAWAFDECGGDFSKINQVSPEMANIVTQEFLGSMGVDARFVQGDRQTLANTLFFGPISLMKAIVDNGYSTDVRQLNSLEGARWFASGIMRGLGFDPQGLDDAAAVQFTDAFSNYFISKLARIGDAQEQLQQAPQRTSQPSRTRRASSPRFQTNQDIFGDPEVMHRVAMEKL